MDNEDLIKILIWNMNVINITDIGLILLALLSFLAIMPEIMLAQLAMAIPQSVIYADPLKSGVVCCL